MYPGLRILSKFIDLFFEGYSESLKCRVWEARNGEGEEFSVSNMVRYANPNVLEEMDNFFNLGDETKLGTVTALARSQLKLHEKVLASEAETKKELIEYLDSYPHRQRLDLELQDKKISCLRVNDSI